MLERSIKPIQDSIENCFSVNFKDFSQSEDKLLLIKKTMLQIFNENTLEEGELHPYINSLANDYLDMFFRFIW